MKNPISLLRLIALFEATSFLLLLGVGMPLKYLYGQPMAVRALGMIHGCLFLGYCWALYQSHCAAKWPLSRTATFFVASLLPFVPFFLDPRLKKYAAELERA